MKQRGFIAGILPGGWQVMAALAAVVVLLWWLYTGALEDKAAAEQRNAQLVQDVRTAGEQLAKAKAEQARVDALLASRERERANAMREWAEAEARYQRAVRDDSEAQAWGDVRAPEPVIDFLCGAELRHADQGGTPAATFCATRKLPGPGADGAAERRSAPAVKGPARRAGGVQPG